jgi:hypothetical protein
MMGRDAGIQRPQGASLIVFFFFAVIVVAGWYFRRFENQRVERELRRSFARQTFQTALGPISGAALKVVKIHQAPSGVRRRDPLFELTFRDDPYGGDAFWYCVGPGPSYFLAIALLQAGSGKVDAQWVVRPLTEARMRGALIGDRKATALAFGNAMEG